jgi:hypothetical protein
VVGGGADRIHRWRSIFWIDVPIGILVRVTIRRRQAENEEVGGDDKERE